MAGMWFRPVCDDLLTKMVGWLTQYEKGEVYATRDWLNLDGVTVELPTKYVHRLLLRPSEVHHWANIMAALAPDNPLTRDVTKICDSMRRRFTDIPLKNRPRLLGSEWIVPLAWYAADIGEVIKVLLEARDGKTATIDDLREQQKAQGKDLFEV